MSVGIGGSTTHQNSAAPSAALTPGSGTALEGAPGGQAGIPGACSIGFAADNAGAEIGSTCDAATGGGLLLSRRAVRGSTGTSDSIEALYYTM